MARRYARNDSDENEERPRRQRKKAGPPVGPILLLVGLMIGAVVVARMIASRPKAEETVKTERPASDIFGDLEIEAPPTYTPGKTPKRMVDKAPAGLADSALWIEAKGIAKQAAAVLTEAKAAKAVQDYAGWDDKGVKAKNLFDEAIIMTADWESELMEKYGDNDRQVAAIMNERSKWFDMLRILHKTTGR